jgi:hypothetical protein
MSPDPNQLFYDALARAQAGGKRAFIRFEDGEINVPVGDPPIEYLIFPEYGYPAMKIHVDKDAAPETELRYINVDVGNKLRVHSAPGVASPTVAYFACGVGVELALEGRVVLDHWTWARVVKVEGRAVTSPQWIAFELTSETDPNR